MVGYLCNGPVTDDRCRLCVSGRHPVSTRDDRWFCTSSLRHIPDPRMQDIYKARTQIEIIYPSPNLRLQPLYFEQWCEHVPEVPVREAMNSMGIHLAPPNLARPLRRVLFRCRQSPTSRASLDATVSPQSTDCSL